MFQVSTVSVFISVFSITITIVLASDPHIIDLVEDLSSFGSIDSYILVPLKLFIFWWRLKM